MEYSALKNIRNMLRLGKSGRRRMCYGKSQFVTIK